MRDGVIVHDLSTFRFARPRLYARNSDVSDPSCSAENLFLTFQVFRELRNSTRGLRVKVALVHSCSVRYRLRFFFAVSDIYFPPASG